LGINQPSGGTSGSRNQGRGASRSRADRARIACAQPALSLQPDERLLRLAREGEAAAFETFVQRYRSSLIAYCGRYLDGAQAEDVAQEAFLKLFQKLREGAEIDHPRAWVYRVASNAAINATTRKGSSWEELDVERAGAASAETVAEDRDRLNSLVEGIKELPQKQRDAVVQHEFQDVDFAQMVDTLGTSEQGAWQLLMRARRKLRDRVAVVFPLFLLRWILPSSGDYETKQRVARLFAAKQTTKFITKLAIGFGVTLGLFGVGLAVKQMGTDTGFALGNSQRSTGEEQVADADGGSNSQQTIPGADVTTGSQSVPEGSVTPADQQSPGSTPSPGKEPSDGSLKLDGDTREQGSDQGAPGKDGGRDQSSSGGNGGSSTGGSSDGGTGGGGTGGGGTGGGGTGGGGTGGGGSASHSWSAPAALTSIGSYARDPHIAFRGDDVIATWRWWDGSRNRVQVATGRVVAAARSRADAAPQLSFDEPQEISQTLHEIPEGSGLPRVAIGGNGEAFAIWSEQDQTLSSLAKIHVAVRTPDGEFGEPVQISRNGRGAAHPQIAAFADGGALAVWVEDTPVVGTNVVKASIRPPGGSFGEAQEISDRNASYSHLKLVANSRGDAVASWLKTGSGQTPLAQVAVREAGDWFGVDQRLSGHDEYATEPAVSINESGLAMATWASYSDGAQATTTFGIKANVKYPGGAFGHGWDISPQSTVPTSIFGRTSTLSALTDSGRGAAGWHAPGGWAQVSPGVTRRLYPIGIAERRSQGGFNESLTLNQNGGDPSFTGDPQAQYDSDGDLAVVAAGVYDGIDGKVQAITQSADGEVSDPHVLSSTDCNKPRMPQAAADDAGNVIAIWQCRGDDDTSHVEVAIAG